MNIVGQKGQVVIAKEIRDELGIRPGWLALQRIVNDHVEIYFIPPEHRKSLKGSLAKYLGGHMFCLVRNGARPKIPHGKMPQKKEWSQWRPGFERFLGYQHSCEIPDRRPA